MQSDLLVETSNETALLPPHDEIDITYGSGSARHSAIRSSDAQGTGFGCCCLIFSMYFWKNHFWMSIMFSSRPWMYA